MIKIVNKPLKHQAKTVFLLWTRHCVACGLTSRLINRVVTTDKQQKINLMSCIELSILRLKPDIKHRLD